MCAEARINKCNALCAALIYVNSPAQPCANLAPMPFPENDQVMNRNVLYVAIGVLAVAAVVFGYQLYQERQKTTGIEISVGKSGISIQKK